VALKIIEVERQSRKNLLVREVEIMKLIKHENMVSFLECFVENSKLWIEMELMEGGEETISNCTPDLFYSYQKELFSVQKPFYIEATLLWVFLKMV
jgi:serine/threonine protein kinase